VKNTQPAALLSAFVIAWLNALAALGQGSMPDYRNVHLIRHNSVENHFFNNLLDTAAASYQHGVGYCCWTGLESSSIF
jgi:hypothetical protein